MQTITYDELKGKYENKLLKDAEVECKLLLKTKDGYVVEINGEWEGFIPNSHILPDTEEKLKQKETIKAVVINGADKADRYVLSSKIAKEKEVLQKLQELKQNNSILSVAISKAVKGGAEVYIEGLRAFLPGRYIRLPGLSPEEWVNKEISVLIEELDPQERKIILNQKRAVEIERKKLAQVTLQNLGEGQIVEAPIIRIADFGVFLDLGGLDGLVPASELSWGRFNHPRDVYKVGDIVKARVFRIEKDNQRVALSIKQLQGDPWEDVERELQIGTELTGKVIAEAAFGLFVELRPGVEALLHNTEIVSEAVKPKVGNEINVKVIKIDLDERKIGLSIKDLQSQQLPFSENVSLVENTIEEISQNGEAKTVNEEIEILNGNLNLVTSNQTINN